MRVIAYDTTAGFLSFVWFLGAWFARLRGHADFVLPVSSWEDLRAGLARAKGVAGVEVWGHGAPGNPYLGGKAIAPAELESIAAVLRMLGVVLEGRPPILTWRSCAVFAGEMGKLFAERCAGATGWRIAGFTYLIGWRWGWQSGLHVLEPGTRPSWPSWEGYSPDRKRLLWSSGSAPSSIWCLSRGPT